MNHHCVARALALLACVFTILFATRFCEATPNYRLGSNLTEVNDYSPQLPFINLFSSSREWFTQCAVGVDPGCTNQNSWDTGEAGLLNLDSQGWVKTLPSPAAAPIFTSVATYWDVPAQFPAGRYIVLYDGQGTIQYQLGAQKNAPLSQPGRDVIDVNPANGGIYLRITSTDPSSSGNYIRNIRFVAEAKESLLATTRFSSEFLARLAPYEVLRFMDWMRTNNSVVTSWSSRAKSTDARFSTEKGVPIEVMVELANTTGKAPWFNIPHQVDNTFIQNFATLTKSSLASNLPVFVEYSNEIWNSLFAQGAWIEARGETTWPGGGASGFTKRINYHGKRSAEICDIWKAVFSDDPDRVVCVIGSQAANSWTGDEALACPLWNQAPCAAHGIDALAIAPYFGDYVGQEENFGEALSWSLADLFAELSAGGQLTNGPSGGAITQSFEWIDTNLQVASAHSVSLVTYEGGQHLVGIGSAGDSQAITDLFTSANRDARMGSAYEQYLAGWEARGGGLFMHFTDITDYSRYGSWGALEVIGQTTSPKFEALYKYSLGTLPPVAQPTPNSTPSVTLRVRRRTGGKVVSSSTGISCGSNCQATVAENRRVSLTARAARRYQFVRWSGACRHSRPRCVISMKSSRNVSAIFRRRR